MSNRDFMMMAAMLNSGGVQFDKLIIPLSDLGIGIGGEVTFSFATNEIALFSDFPVYLRLNNATQWIGPLSEFKFVGPIEQIHVRRAFNVGMGRCVIFSGNPFLGVDFRREDPRWLSRFTFAGMAPTTWAATTATWDSAPFLLPAASGVPQEAYYLWSFDAVRDSGTIDTLEFIESESGISVPLYKFKPGTVSARLVIDKEFPIRLSTSGIFRLTGSPEAGIVNVAVDATFSLV